jgi:hypothetical protein
MQTKPTPQSSMAHRQGPTPTFEVWPLDCRPPTMLYKDRLQHTAPQTAPQTQVKQYQQQTMSCSYAAATPVGCCQLSQADAMAVADAPGRVTRPHSQAAAEAPLPPAQVAQLVRPEATQLGLVHLRGQGNPHNKSSRGVRLC